MKKVVLLTEPYVEATDAKPLERLKGYAEVRVARGASEEELVQEVKDASALIVRLAILSRINVRKIAGKRRLVE